LHWVGLPDTVLAFCSDWNSGDELMNRHVFISALGVLALAACSGDNIQQRLLPELNIENTMGSINLQLPPVDDKAHKQSTTVIVRNTGEANMKVTRMEWIDKPSRLDVIGPRGNACVQDNECGAGICLTSTCIELGFAQTPIEIEPGLRYDIEFVIAQGSGELNCPQPSANVPEEYQLNYCGSFVIETDATNTSGIIVDGKTTIYMLRPTSSGQIEITPDFIEFLGVQPGTTQSRDFSVRNTGTQDLNVEQIFMESRSEFFRIAGETPPLDIAPGTAQTWTLTVDIPVGADASQYEGFTNLVVVSGAVNASIGGRVPVQVSAGAGSAPLIEVEPATLTFDQNNRQTLTVHNRGEATLQVTSMNVTPASARQFYRWEVDGTDVTNNFQIINVPRDQSKEITIVFDRPAGNEASAVATLQLNHNDRISNSRTEVTLLGDAGDVPIARIYPQGFTFQAAVGESDSRTFVIRNVGTADLEITDATLSFSIGDASGSEFQVSGHLGTIPPGGMKAGTVTFTGTNAQEDIGVVVFTSNDPGAMLELGIKDVVSASPAVTAVITPGSTNDAVVGRVVSFSASESIPADALENSLWTLAERPANSNAFFFSTGPDLQFVPDVAGSYRIVLLLSRQLRESEDSYTLTVVP